MLTKKTIGFLGAGNLAEALIKGLLVSKSVSPAQITASDTVASRLAHLAEEYEIKVCNRNFEVAAASDILFITVKPHDVPALLREIAPEIGKGTLLISAAAGVTTSAIGDVLRGAGLARLPALIRAMPNTPAIVREAMTGLYAGAGATRSELKLASAVFESVGKVAVIDDEDLLNPVTGLSGSGPAYVFLFMEALTEAGVKAGLSEADSKLLAIQTTLGAARLAMESDKTLPELRRMVSSPGGTTIEGLKKLEEAGFKAAVIGAVEAATKRAGELSKPSDK
ncbi:MAG: pyrroline-5-carboxylate reductase [Deltaproteobacteria bacterium]